MIHVQPIEQKRYLQEKSCLGLKNTLSFDLLKSRPAFNPKRQRYVATKGIHISFDINADNIKQLKALYKKLRGKEPSVYLSSYDVVASVLGQDGTYLTAYSAPLCSTLRLDKADQYYKHFEVDIYEPADFTELPETKRDIEKRLEAEHKNRKATFNALVAKDIILNELNVLGYNIYSSGDRYLGFSKVKGYNSLIKDALEYYINNKVLKNVGCKIKVCKVKNQHKYGYYDYLCDLGEVETKLK